MENFIDSHTKSLLTLERFVKDLIKPLQIQVKHDELLKEETFGFIFRDFLTILAHTKNFLDQLPKVMKKKPQTQLQFWIRQGQEQGFFRLLEAYSHKLRSILAALSHTMKQTQFRFWILKQSRNSKKPFTSLEFFLPLTLPIRSTPEIIKFWFKVAFPNLQVESIEDKKKHKYLKNYIFEFKHVIEKKNKELIELEKLYRLDSKGSGDFVLNLVSKNRKIEQKIEVHNITNLDTTLVSKSNHTLYILTDLILITQPNSKNENKIQYLYVLPIVNITIYKIIDKDLYIKSADSSLKIQFDSIEDIKNIISILQKIRKNSIKLKHLQYGTERIDKLEQNLINLENKVSKLRNEVNTLQQTIKNREPLTKLPRNWKKVLSKAGREYYFNVKTLETSWKIPKIIHQDWRPIKTNKKETLYYNIKTKWIIKKFPERKNIEAIEEEAEQEKVNQERQRKLHEVLQKRMFSEKILKIRNKVSKKSSSIKEELIKQEQVDKEIESDIKEELEDRIWFEIFDQDSNKPSFYGMDTKVVRERLPKDTIIIKLSKREAEHFIRKNNL
ncbi:hypothetical protein M0812_02700 [Anaeramoeba flamelloides]|uniref:WW domain-containing protein n=1 Tax=Anaeramoeba flamelloides TaxID=1746091 RepID=A0AAV7YNG4_9EUKA|nr:hypothetical protein M0812_02700 [Anaeramoeba flamelloides]